MQHAYLNEKAIKDALTLQAITPSEALELLGKVKNCKGIKKESKKVA